VGAGAVGGYFGAKLAVAGHELVFIARGKHLDIMCRKGLRVRSPAGDLHVQDALFTADPGRAGPAELILLCVKSYDTDSALETLPRLVQDKTAILSLQNGIDNPDKIAHSFGDRRTLAGVVYVGAQVIAPGVIEHSSGGRIILGARADVGSEAADTAARAFDAAAIPCEISNDIQSALWRKLLWNAPFCAISALTRATVEDIVASDSLTNLAAECMEEVRRAAQCRGVVLPRRLISEIFEFSKTLGAFKPSMLQDLEARKPLEYEAFNGILVRLLGEDAPVNRVFNATLQFLDRKIRQEASRNNHG
jgi:2-dehydropantoate 2-reductase